MPDRDDIRERLEHQIKNEEQDLEKWKRQLDEDPFYALEWSDAAFETAARLRVYKQVHAALADQPLERVAAHCLEKVLAGARHPEHSTSVVSNHLKEQLTKVWAEVYNDYLRG